MDSVAVAAQVEGLDTVLPLLEQASHEEALPLIEEGLAKQPELPIWKYLKALTISCQSGGSEALTLIEECKEMEGFDSGFGLAETVNTALRTTALNHLQFETTVEPTDDEPWRVCEAMAAHFGRPDHVEKTIVNHWKYRPESEPAMTRFQEAVAEKPLEERLALVEQVMEHDQETCLPRALLGLYLQEKGKTALAIRHLKQAHDTNSKAWQPHFYLGQVFVGQGRFEDAETRFTEAIQLKGESSPGLYREIAECQKATYRFDEAAETLFKSLEEFPAQFDSWDDLTEIANAAGLKDRLEAALAAASAGQSADSGIGSRMVKLALESQDPLSAQSQLESLGVEQNPEQDKELTELAAEVLMTLRESDRAIALLEKALAPTPEDRELRTLYGFALLKSARNEDAEVVLKETALQHPNERPQQIAWGRALLAIGDGERANRAFSLASRLDPNDAEAMSYQAQALLQLGQVDEATPLLKEGVKKIDPPLAVTLTGLGAVYEKKGLADIAKDFFRQALFREVGNEEAAQGWLRQTHSALEELKEQCTEFLQAQSSDFGRCALFLNLLHSSLYEGFSEVARFLMKEFHPSFQAKIESEEYRRYLELHLTKRIPLIASKLEKTGQLEKAREVWRFGATSADPELSQKATSELLRLDTVEASLVEPGEEQNNSAEIAAPSGDGDPLLSLLSTTLPEGEEGSGEELALFTDSTASEPSTESPLFADTPDSVTPVGEEVSLFAAPIEDVLSGAAEASEQTEAPMTEVPVAEAPPSAEPVAAVTETVDAAPSEEAPLFDIPLPEEENAQATPSPQEESLDEASPEMEAAAAIPVENAAEVAVAEAAPVPVSDAPEAAEPAPADEVEAVAAAEVQAEVSAETPSQALPAAEAPALDQEIQSEPTTPVEAVETPSQADLAPTEAPSPELSQMVPAEAPAPAVPEHERLEEEPTPEPSIDIPLPPAEPVLAETPEPVEEATPSEPEEVQEVLPQQVGEATAPEVAPVPSPTPIQAEPSTHERKELLPIPMAVDFEPQTRRQLHFHEALAQNPGGMISSEALAHLMVTSTLTHEPPDPHSESAEPNSGESFATALVQSANSLSAQQNYRGASRLLKTALLYKPDSAAVGEAMLQLNSSWAQWLASQGEFAHAVSLIRETAQRVPQASQLEGLLESTYQQWMTWSEEKGDPAARDLLAVYLQREQASLQQFRAQWQAFQEQQAAATQAPAVPSTPPVSPEMPEATPTVVAEPAAAPPVEATPIPEVAPAETPQAEAPAPTEPSVPAETPAPAAVAEAPQVEPAAPAPVAEAPVPEVAPTPTPVAETPSPEVAAAAAPAPTPVETAPTPEPVAEAPQAAAQVPAPEPVAEAAPVSEAPSPAPVEAAAAAEAVAEPAPVAAPVAAVAETPVEAAPAASPEPAAPTPVAETPAPAAAASVAYGSDDEALAALDANPDSAEIQHSVFAHFVDSMRALTTALRDRAGNQADKPIWLLLLARAFRKSGSETMAVIQYQKYIKAAPSLEAYEELATTYEEIGKEDFAKMTRRKAERAFS